MKILVTGGGGFLGKALVSRLIQDGHTIRSFARGDYPDVVALGAEMIRGDLANYDEIYEAMTGCELVYHVAAKAGVWGAYDSFYTANVVGTEHVIKACRAHGIHYLVNTSSPSVIFDGTDQEGLNETKPYPATYLSNYPKTKAMAERLVMEASDTKLKTVSLRPHLIWGPEDTQLIPRLVKQARAGKIRFIGCGTKLIDAVYIDNVVDAHIQAAQTLMNSEVCAGKTYFITNDEPWPFDKILNGILASAKVLPVDKHLSEITGYIIGATLEVIYTVLRKKEEPPMTRFVARQLATAHWYDISAAKIDLTYTPSVSMDEGMKRLANWFAEQNRENGK